MEYKGDIEGFPEEVVNWMLDQQEKQGNKRDVTVFELNAAASREDGGFYWDETEEGFDFCSNVVEMNNFNLFFKRYPSGYKLITEAEALEILAEYFKTDKIKIV